MSICTDGSLCLQVRDFFRSLLFVLVSLAAFVRASSSGSRGSSSFRSFLYYEQHRTRRTLFEQLTMFECTTVEICGNGD